MVGRSHFYWVDFGRWIVDIVIPKDWRVSFLCYDIVSPTLRYKLKSAWSLGGCPLILDQHSSLCSHSFGIHSALVLVFCRTSNKTLLLVDISFAMRLAPNYVDFKIRINSSDNKIHIYFFIIFINMKISIDLTDKDLNSLSLKSRLHDLSS